MAINLLYQITNLKTIYVGTVFVAKDPVGHPSGSQLRWLGTVANNHTPIILFYIYLNNGFGLLYPENKRKLELGTFSYKVISVSNGKILFKSGLI